MLWEFHDHKQAVYGCIKLEIFHDYKLNVINKLLAHNSRNEPPIVNNKKEITKRRIKKEKTETSLTNLSKLFAFKVAEKVSYLIP